MVKLLLRKALFPGKNGEQQLDLITDLVGAPSREDMQSLRSSRVKELLRSMRGKTAADFRAYYPPEADDLELALIKEMLLFSADKRTPAGQAIQVRARASSFPRRRIPQRWVRPGLTPAAWACGSTNTSTRSATCPSFGYAIRTSPRLRMRVS